MKNIRIALMACLVALMAVACEKDEEEATVYTTDRFKLEMAPFTDGNGTKIYLQFDELQSHLIYEEGDKVRVNGTPFTIQKDGDDWYAVGTRIEAPKFYAAYVDGTLGGWNESTHTYSFNINSTMFDKLHNKVILAGTSDDGYVLTMKPACAIIRVNTGSSGRTWTDVSVGFGSGKVLKRGTLNPSDRTLTPGYYLDAHTTTDEGELLAMRWSKQGTSDYVGDEDGYWYVAVPIAGSSVTTKLYFKWTNGSGTTYFQTNGEVTLQKGRVYTVGTERQSPFSDEGYSKYFFNVDASHLVAFSAGNLQCSFYYQGLSGMYKWQFASNQYDVIGTGNNKIGDAGYWFDLFGYGTSNYNSGVSAYLSSSTSITASDYFQNDLAGSNADWGVYNSSTPGVYYGNTLVTTVSWRTLTRSEWNYLINRSGKCGLVCIAGAYNGLLLLPNTGLMGMGEWANTTGVDLSSLSKTTLTNLSESDWGKLEAIGAIFLPCAGTRTGKASATLQNTLGQYWSANQKDATRGRALTFYMSPLSCATSDTPDKYIGSSVRLVANVGW